ncbi:MAG: sigma factor-like helix-turn-helix DNA-binding protein [Thermomicrobiales bacterium]
MAANPSDAVHERAVPVEPALAALAALVAMVDALPERAYDVVTMRQGFDDAGAMTLEEVGAHLGVTRERIRQIERKELDRLRRRRLLFEPALASVDVWRNTLGLSWRDRRLPPIMATVAPGTLWTDNGLVRFLLRLFEDRLQPADGIEDVEMAVVAILTGKDSLSAEELDAEVRLYLAPDDLARFPDFAVASRMDLLGPAVRRADGRFQLPPTAIEGLSDKRIRRLQAMRRVLEQRGPSHYSVIAEDLRALLPADYRMSERDVHSWLGRYDRIFVWAGTGVYGLMSQNVGIRADHQPSSSEPSTTTGRSRRRGCGQEIEQLLRERGPLPLAEIEDHVLARFQIRRSSVYAALTQGGIKRFVVGPDHIVSLRPDDEGEPSQDVRPEP